MPNLHISTATIAAQQNNQMPLSSPLSFRPQEPAIPDQVTRRLFAQRLALLIKRMQVVAQNLEKEELSNDCRLTNTP